MEDLVVEEFEQRASVQTKNALASNCKKIQGKLSSKFRQKTKQREERLEHTQNVIEGIRGGIHLQLTNTLCSIEEDGLTQYVVM